MHSVPEARPGRNSAMDAKGEGCCSRQVEQGGSESRTNLTFVIRPARHDVASGERVQRIRAISGLADASATCQPTAARASARAACRYGIRRRNPAGLARVASADVVGGCLPRLCCCSTGVPPEAFDNRHRRGIVRRRGDRLPRRRRAQRRILRFDSRPADRALPRRFGGDDHRARGSRRRGARPRRRPAADPGDRDRGDRAGGRDTRGGARARCACAIYGRSCRDAPDHLHARRKRRRRRGGDPGSPPIYLWRAAALPSPAEGAAQFRQSRRVGLPRVSGGTRHHRPGGGKGGPYRAALRLPWYAPGSLGNTRPAQHSRARTRALGPGAGRADRRHAGRRQNAPSLATREPPSSARACITSWLSPASTWGSWRSRFSGCCAGCGRARWCVRR